MEIAVNVFLSGSVQIIGMIAAIFFILCLAFLLDYFNLTMSWYTRPRIIFGLFMCPCFILLSMFLIIFNTFVENVSITLIISIIFALICIYFRSV